MLVIPAIDLKAGRCVRLRQGRMAEEAVFSDAPLSVAQRWVDAGARRLHIVDLDGAVDGRPVHAPIISTIAQQFPDLPIEVGGGIRDEETARTYLDAGVRFVILGTRAITDPDFVKGLCLKFPGQIIVGLDTRQGKVATAGWVKTSNHSAIDMALRFEGDGIAAIIHTDITRDGMMLGPGIEATVALAESIRTPVIASGGVSRLQDIEALCKVADKGIAGVVVGRALYENTLDLEEAQALADRLGSLG